MSNSSGEHAICFNCMSLLNGETVCARCGHDNGAPYDPDYKKPGSVLVSRYLVGWLQEKNGEGALYKGYDRTRRTPVWIREYFPRTIARRDSFTGDVTPREGCEAQYKALMSDFVDLCEEVHRAPPSDAVIPIEDVFPQDNTVYTVYRELPVISLEEYLEERGGKLPVQEAIDLMLPLCNSLSNLHDRGAIHRGISPHTIYIDPKEGRLYFWGFALSATRTGGSELEAELFDGYSAPEQYAINGWQGTWTDVYAMAAVFYRVVSGFVPPKSVQVSLDNPLSSLFDLVMDISMEVSEAVDLAMAAESRNRTQSVSAFTAQLISQEGSNTSVYDTNRLLRGEDGESTRRTRTRRRGGGTIKYWFLGLFVTVLALGLVFYLLTTTYLSGLLPDSADTAVTGNGQNSQQGENSEGGPEEEGEGEEERESAVPSFVGQVADELLFDQEYLSRYQFKVQEEYNDLFAEGTVFDQSPVGGTPMLNRGTVILYVSKGNLVLEMPDLSEMTLEEAQEALSALSDEHGVDLTYLSLERFERDAEGGKVLDTVPAAGEEFDPKSTRIIIHYAPEVESEEESQEETSPQSSSQPSTPSTPSTPESSTPSRRPGMKDERGVDM